VSSRPARATSSAAPFFAPCGRAMCVLSVGVPSGDYASIRAVTDQETPESGVTFVNFILSLATTAAVHFGDIADPATGLKTEPNLVGASQMIELIAMLQDKTRGNLLEPEERMIDDLLYELRLRFVQAQQSERRIVEP
jgi:hypothetical protein